MRRLASAISLLLLTAALAGCSGGSTPVATDLARETASGGGGTPPQPPQPPAPRGCPQFFDILLSTRVDPTRDPIVHPGHLMVDACANPNEPTHAFIAFKLRDQAPILKIPGISVECLNEASGDCFTGHKEERFGNPQRGVHITWNTKFNVHETNTGETRVIGELDRLRVRWITINGERREDIDRLHCTFTGRPGTAPPPPPGPPVPPGGGNG